MSGTSEPPSLRETVLALLRRFGHDALSFPALESGMRYWFDDETPGVSRACMPEACVAYVDTGSAWVAAGAPLADPTRVAQVASAFVRAARSAGKRACFFGTERPELDGFEPVLLGQQPLWSCTEWPATVARHRRLREQIRRGASKGVVVRRVAPSELAPGSALRARFEALAAEWLASRPMAPMGFVVALEPFAFPDEHRYLVAEKGGEAVAFLSAVPIYAAHGWLVEDLPRSRRAPNGTAELLVDAMMRDAADRPFVTLGLAPLSGPVGPWLRFARFVGRPLYDFRGLQAFKQRLRPSSWQSVWLLYPRSELAAVHVVDSLRAFAGGSLVAFGLRTLALHPSAPPWVLALPLIPWTMLLAGLVVAGRSELLGFSAGALAAWCVFDALLVVQLLRSASRPRASRLVTAAVAALVDAVASVRHLALFGLGSTTMATVLRAVATLAPCLGAVVLAWASAQAIRRSARAR